MLSKIPLSRTTKNPNQPSGINSKKRRMEPKRRKDSKNRKQRKLSRLRMTKLSKAKPTRELASCQAWTNSWTIAK
jgi:hypothetical protein